MAEPIGDLLLRHKTISLAQLSEAQETARTTGRPLLQVLADRRLADENELTSVLGEYYKIKTVDLSEYEIDEDVIRLVELATCERFGLIPLSRASGALIVAISDPSTMDGPDAVRFATRLKVETVLATRSAIAQAIDRYCRNHDTTLQTTIDELSADLTPDVDTTDPEQLANESEQAPIIRIVNSVLLSAIHKGASDIHIDPFEAALRIRLRIDGVLIQHAMLPVAFSTAVASRIKVLSKLDISERRKPQDGRMRVRYGTVPERTMDFRVSVLPTKWGEAIVVRLLDNTNLRKNMSELGFDPDVLRDFTWAIKQPWGMVLVTGPTGSGKTTTLYSALAELNTISVNIRTVEDPIEYDLAGINQVEVHEDIGRNFATVLRSFLRQDPDIIMVGEIRDFETAETAVKASLTGHLVLSTLHTNDAPSTITRLLNMGIEPFLVTASVNLVLAQRLVRRVCRDCAELIPIDRVKNTLLELGTREEDLATATVQQGRGCRTCSNTGYKGRVALYEALRLTEPLKDAIIRGASASELKTIAIQHGMITLRRSGIRKILEGKTTPEEVARVTMND